MSRSLWMGDLEPYMDEAFINQAFSHITSPEKRCDQISENGRVLPFRKDNGLPAAYCFVEFTSEEEAERVLKTVNATNMPGSNPVKRFRLNRSQAGKNSDQGPSFSIFVGDLDAVVTDDKLQDFFAKKYKSVKGAKIMYEEGGLSRGYGFVRFGDETEQKRALLEMQGATGLGSKAIRVSVATPKGKMYNNNNSSYNNHYSSNSYNNSYNNSTSNNNQDQQQSGASGDYSKQWMKHYADNYQYYQQYMNYYNQQDAHYQQQNYQQYQQYQQQQQYFQQQQQQQQSMNNSHHHHNNGGGHHNNSHQQNNNQQQQQQADKLEDPCPPIDVDLENSIYFRQRTILLDNVLGSHWQPVDNANTKLSDM